LVHSDESTERDHRAKTTPGDDFKGKAGIPHVSRSLETWRPKYWTIIRSSAAQFLTPHADPAARIYRGLLQPKLSEDMRHELRSLAAGVVRLAQGFLASIAGRRPARSRSRQPYLLLVTPGSGKYAREEREVKQACAARGLPILRVHSDTRGIESDDKGTLLLRDVLTPLDYCRVLCLWLARCAGAMRWWFSGDRKARSLSVAAIPGIRQYYLDRAFARRIESLHGRPRAVLTISPWSDVSVAIVDHVRKRAIPTAGIRTQTTLQLEEHLVINTDVLFCKGVWEKGLYACLFGGHGPALVDGCLLSLPEEYDLEPLALPDDFVLLLGTARQFNQDETDYRDACRLLEQVAEASGLPVVYRAHPAHAEDATRFMSRNAARGNAVVVTDIRRNRELIDRASLIVSAHTTLLYQAMLSGIPAVIVNADAPGSPSDEFHGSPLTRVEPEQLDRIKDYDWRALRDSAEHAREWFSRNYFLDKGAAFLVDSLLEHAP
jgi:hypothetical protein